MYYTLADNSTPTVVPLLLCLALPYFLYRFPYAKHLSVAGRPKYTEYELGYATFRYFIYFDPYINLYMRNTFQWQADQNTLGTSLVTALFAISSTSILTSIYIYAGHFSVAGWPIAVKIWEGYYLSHKLNKIHLHYAYDHTTMNTPVLVWSRKLSIVGPG